MKKHTADNQNVNPAEEKDSEKLENSAARETGDNVTENGETASDTLSDGAEHSEEPAEKEEAKTPAKDFEKEAAEWKDKYIRLQAEFDNFRKRTLKEKMDLVQSGGSKVITGMLQVLDDVLRAVEASEKSEDIAALREGEKLVAQKFTGALRKEGVTEIEAKGHDFDADLHEAVAKFAAGEEQKGKVIDVVQRGYKLGDKVLRYAKVVVGE